MHPTITQMRKTRLRAPASQAHRINQIGAYFDASSGCQLVIARPSAEPTLWEAFLQGARASYRRHGVERVLEYANIVGGHQTALFFAAVTRDGRVVGGMRAQDHIWQWGRLTRCKNGPAALDLTNSVTRLPSGYRPASSR